MVTSGLKPQLRTQMKTGLKQGLGSLHHGTSGSLPAAQPPSRAPHYHTSSRRDLGLCFTSCLRGDRKVQKTHRSSRETMQGQKNYRTNTELWDAHEQGWTFMGFQANRSWEEAAPAVSDTSQGDEVSQERVLH